MWLWSIAATFLVVSFGLFLQKPDPPPILGVYMRPGKFFYIKYWLMRLLLWLRKRKESNETKKKSFKDLDKAQPFSDSPKAFDAVFYHAVTQNGFYVVTGIERRKHNIANGLIYLLVPEIGLLCNLQCPDTILFDAKDDAFEACGLRIEPVEPLRKWKLSFKGSMKLHDNPKKQYRVEFNGVYSSDWPVFNYETDLDASGVATALATEPWSLQYFKNFEKNRQSHYEQMGRMEATVAVDDKTYNLPNMQSFRDHSLGAERDWDLMHRYSYHMLYMEDGTRVALGVVCQPATSTVFQFGYKCSPDGEYQPIEWTDLQLYQHGENGKPPTDYAFRFKSGGKEHTVQVSVEQDSVHYKGWRWEALMVERFVSYTMDGARGRGVSEWHYHSSKGRPSSVSAQDPPWFAEVVDEYYGKKKE